VNNKFITFFLIFSVLLISLQGCNHAQTGENSQEWPEEKTFSIQIEGMEEEIEARLFIDEEIGKKTYYPSPMEPVTKPGEVWFYYSWNGEINENAYVRFSQVDPEKTKDLGEKVFDPEWIFPEEGWQLREESSVSDEWQDRIYLYSNENLGRAAKVELGRDSEGKSFFFVTQYQYEYGDGIYPRARLIKENFFCLEKNEYLLKMNSENSD